MNEQDYQKWAMFCHLSSLVWIPPALFRVTIPFLNLVGPLVMWWVKKDENTLVDVEGKESLNFQLSMSLYSLIGLIIFGILALINGLVTARVNLDSDQKSELLPGGIQLWQDTALIVFGIFQLVVVIVAGLKANKGEFYRYPLAIRFLK